MPPYLTQYFEGMSGHYNAMRWVVPYKDRDEVEASLLPVLYGNRRKRVALSFSESAQSGNVWIQFLGWANQRFYVVPKYRSYVRPSDGWKRQIIPYRTKDKLSEALEKYMKRMKKNQQVRVQICGGLMTVSFEWAPTTPAREEAPPITKKENGKKIIRFTVKRKPAK